MNTAQYEKFGFCTYCGCGCRLKFQVSNSRVEKVLQDGTDPVSRGSACIKGLTSCEVINTNRLKYPQYRPVKSRGLIDCSWQKAYGFISQNLKELEQYDDNGVQDLVFFVPDGQSSNEFNYLFSKLCRSVYHSNNIDSCARLCHQSTTVAFNNMMGIQAIPEYCMDDLSNVDCFLMIGTDPLEDYPVMFDRIISAKSKGAKIITLDVTSTSTTNISDINLQVTADGIVPFVSWLVSRLIESGKISKDVRLFHNFEEFFESAKEVSRKFPPSTLGLSKAKMEMVYNSLINGKRVGICFGMGAVQHSNGTQNAQAIIGLGLLLGAVVFPNRGKVNIQGAGDMGGYPDWDSQKVDSFEDWNVRYREHKGRILTDALYDKDVKFLWVVGGDLAVSMPDLNLFEESLRHKFIVYQGHHPSRIADFASVVLPMKMLSEDEGTITNGERRVRGLEYLGGGSGQYKSGVEIICEYAKHVGAKGFDFKNIKCVTDEIINVVPGYEGLSLEKIYSDNGQFADKKPKFFKFEKIKYDYAHFQGSGKFPFILTTARSKFHFCTGIESRNSRSLLSLSGEPCVYMNPLDMEYLGIGDGSDIKIISEVGEVKTKVLKNSDVLKRTIVAQFHFPKLLINKLTPLVLDPLSGIPCYKDVLVRIEVLL